MPRKSTKKPIEETQPTTLIEMKQSEKEIIENSDPVFYQDFYELDSDGVFPQEQITEVILPKVILSNSEELRILQHQPLVLQMYNTKPVAGNLLKALRDGLTRFDLKIFETEEDFSVWSFQSPKIIAVDFGNITSQQRTDYRAVQCEIDFSGLEIDGVTIRTK